MCIQCYPVRLDERSQWNFMYLLSLEDEELIQYISTSPEHEAEHFLSDMRAAFQWLLLNNGNAPTNAHLHFIWEEAGGWRQTQPDRRQQLSTAGPMTVKGNGCVEDLAP
ncbi:hypothetical protein WJX72_011548 [[Myrmecia] bisecta]|uniref:Uncharacterized protein n=1 Tax=[Myrmecia] bisecta TaxID=41462 RepID=A0AAW1PZH3_9CHLO